MDETDMQAFAGLSVSGQTNPFSQVINQDTPLSKALTTVTTKTGPTKLIIDARDIKTLPLDSDLKMSFVGSVGRVSTTNSIPIARIVSKPEDIIFYMRISPAIY